MIKVHCYRSFGLKIPSGYLNNDETLLGLFLLVHRAYDRAYTLRADFFTLWTVSCEHRSSIARRRHRSFLIRRRRRRELNSHRIVGRCINVARWDAIRVMVICNSAVAAAAAAAAAVAPEIHGFIVSAYTPCMFATVHTSYQSDGVGLFFVIFSLSGSSIAQQFYCAS